MIHYESEYLGWLHRRGVGENDRVASSPDSYLSYLRSVSELIGADISPSLLACETDVLAVAQQLNGRRADATIRNYKAAMRQYMSMVQAGAHLQ